MSYFAVHRRIKLSFAFTVAAAFLVIATQLAAGAPSPGQVPTSPPTASSTGVPADVTLTPSSSIRVTEDGTVIDGLDITGSIHVTADNVTIRNSRINANGTWYAIRLGRGVTGTTIESSELFGARSAAINYGSYDAVGLHVHDSRDGLLVSSNSSVTASYIHSLDRNGEGIKVLGGQGSQIVGNHIVASSDGRGSALQLRSRAGNELADWSIASNVLEGGRNTIELHHRGGTIADIRFTDNVIVDQSWTGSPVATDANPTWSGNVFDTGQPIAAPGRPPLVVTPPESPAPTPTAPNPTQPPTTQSPPSSVDTGAPTTPSTTEPPTTQPPTTAPSTSEPGTQPPSTRPPSTQPPSSGPERPAGPCQYTTPNEPFDDPNPDYDGSYGRYPVSNNPIPAGYPTPRTTGICGAGLEPSDLTSSGGLTITTDGAVIDGLDINGSVTVRANNVTIRNSRITSSGHYPLQLASGFDNLVVEDTRIRGVGPGVSTATLLRGHATFRRVHISGGSDNMKAFDGALVEDSYFGGIHRSPGDHNDIVQIRKGNDYVFRNNSMFGPWQRATSVFLFQAKAGAGGGPISNVLVEDNYLSGGGYTIYTRAPDYPLTNATIRDNRLEQDSWQFGPISDDAGATYTNNIIAPS